MRLPNYVTPIVTINSVFVAHSAEYEHTQFFKLLDTRVSGGFEFIPDEIPVPQFQTVLETEQMAKLLGADLVERVVLLGDAVPDLFRSSDEEDAKQWPVFKLNSKQAFVSSLRAARRAEMLLHDMHNFYTFAQSKAGFIDVDKNREKDLERRAVAVSSAAMTIFRNLETKFQEEWRNCLCKNLQTSDALTSKVRAHLSDNNFELYEMFGSLPNDEKLRFLEDTFDIKVKDLLENVR